MPGNGSRHTGKSSGSNRVNEENNGSKVGEHRLCKLWKPALRKRTVSSIKIGRSQCFSLLPYFNWNILYDYIGKDTLFLCGSQAFARFLFSISLFRSLFLLVIIGAQLFDHFFGFTRCCGMANDYLSRLINNDKAGDTQYLPFVSQFGV